MKILRTILVWSHPTAGVVAGVVIPVMSFAGSALALKSGSLEDSAAAAIQRERAVD